MTKFLHIVEQNLPDSEYGDQYDLIMVFKKAVNDLYDSNKIDFKIVPIHGTGSIEIISRDGKSVKLNHRAPSRELAPSEEAEDLAMKKTNTLTDMLKQANPKLPDAAKRAAAAVERQLSSIAANTQK